MNLKEYYLDVAGFVMRFYCADTQTELYLPPAYAPFSISSKEHVDVHIKISMQKPFNLDEGKEIFRADDPERESQNPLWSIYKYEGQNYIVCADAETGHFPSLYAIFPKDTKHWEVFKPENESSNKTVIDHLAYPMGPLLLYHLALYNEAVMIHASGIDDGVNGHLFSGFSGVGKSTMAQLWYDSGHKVINDDRLLLRIIGDKCYMFNTPMMYADAPRKAALDNVFLLRQDKENSMQEIKGISKLIRLMAFCIQHHYDKEHVNIIMQTLEQIVKRISVYELGFLPDKSIVQMIKNECR